MTKQEMLMRYHSNNPDNNYQEAQNRIRLAMEKGEDYVYLPKEVYKADFGWWATDKTIDRLREDGFAINEVWEPAEYWSVEWYEK